MVFIMDQLSVGRDIQRQKNHKNPLLHIHAGGRGPASRASPCLLADILCAVARPGTHASSVFT